MHALQALLQSQSGRIVIAAGSAQQHQQKQGIERTNANRNPNFHHEVTVFKGVTDLPCVK